MTPKPIEKQIEAAKNIEDLVMAAAISKAIEDKRDLLKPSIEHFLSGGNVNGEFDMALKKLMKWVEKKTIEAIIARRTKPVEVEKEYRELLEECEDYFDNKADADHNGENFVPNKEMEILSRIRQFLTK